TAVSGDEDVLRFQIAMDDALVVSGRQSAGDLQRKISGLRCGQRTFEQLRPKRVTDKKLADDERCLFVHSELVNGQQIWMIETASSARLLLQAVALHRIKRDAGDDLDGH